MIRYILLSVLLLMNGINGFCQTPVDSLKIRLNFIEKVNHKRTDSLLRELQYYKVKEDYYSDALSYQTAWFSLLVGGLLAIAGTISWVFIRNEVLKLRKEVNGNVNALSELSEAINEKSDINERNQNLNMALSFINLMRVNVLTAKQTIAIFECTYALDLLSRNYKRAKNDKDKAHDLSQIKGCATQALSITGQLMSKPFNTLDYYMLNTNKDFVLSSINATIQNIDDEMLIEDLHTLKANYKQVLKTRELK